MDRRQQLAAWAKLPRRGALSSYVPPSCCCKCWSPSAISGSLTRITKRLSDMTDAELAALEARMITIPGGLAREHVDEPQATATLTPRRMVTAMRMMRVRRVRHQVTTRRALGGKRGHP